MKRAHSPSSQPDENIQKRKKMVIAKQGDAVLILNDTLSLPEELLFGEIAGFLHWKDSTNLGQVNKQFRKSFLPHCDDILRPLLDKLESLCKSNVHSYCKEVYAPASKRVCTCRPDKYCEPADTQDLAALDPRYENEAYDSLSLPAKCARMIHYLATLVENMRPHLNFSLDMAADPTRMPEAIGTIQGNWSLGMGHRGNALLKLYPRRAALVFNIALIKYVQGAMEEGDDYECNQAFLGNRGIEPGGSFFGQVICDMVEDMLPFSDNHIKTYLCARVIPSEHTRTLLGRSLTARVILCAPFVGEWIDENGRLVLPDSLEHFDRAAAQRAMAQWDQYDDGRDDLW